MPKIALTSITPIKKIDSKVIFINNQSIEVIQYLPIQDKLALIERVLNACIDSTGYFNSVKLNVYFSLELIKAYTNINITEKMMETAPKTYDILVMNHILENVIHAIPEEEYNCIYDATYECGKNAVQFLTSLMGMFKTIAQDYQDTNINMNELMQVLDQPDKVGFVKDVLDKLG